MSWPSTTSTSGSASSAFLPAAVALATASGEALLVTVPANRPCVESVLQQISQVVGGHNIPDRDHLNVFADQALFDQRPENQAANAAEPVNCYFDCHISISILINSVVNQDWERIIMTLLARSIRKLGKLHGRRIPDRRPIGRSANCQINALKPLS